MAGDTVIKTEIPEKVITLHHPKESGPNYCDEC